MRAKRRVIQARAQAPQPVAFISEPGAGMSDKGGVDDATTFTPYLPRVALEWAQQPERQWQTLDASLVFVDVSGFTRLSERLARLGPAGAEELTEVVGDCFTELLADAYAKGGSLLKFGGDALLLAFDGPDHQARAATAAIAMRRTIRRVGNLKTSGGNVRLRTSTGVHSGQLNLFCVGRSHRELIVTGPVASRLLDMEAAAAAGEIVASGDIVAALPPGLVGAEKGPGVLLRDRAVGAEVSEPLPALPRHHADLSSSVPLAVRSHLRHGGSDAEHRYVAMAFLRFSGLDHVLRAEQPEYAADALDKLVTQVQDAADDHEVTFLGTDIDRDGGKIVLVAGAPQAKDDDCGRMLAALRRIADTTGTLSLRIGAHRGCVFVGGIGPAYRRTYTVMGDAVNLTARLMNAAAEGEILATEELLSHSRALYDTTPRAPFAVKGKSEPVRAEAVGHLARGTAWPGRSSTPVSPLVGRDRELDQLLWTLAETHGGSGRTVHISGPAGIGKSRLVDELSRRHDDRPFVCAVSEPYEKASPWSMLRQFLMQAFELEADGTALDDRLRQRVEESAPEQMGWLPLLGDVMGTAIAATPRTMGVEPRVARQRTNELIVALLGAQFPGPGVFVFEDLQWADEASKDAVQKISSAARERAWLILTTSRAEVEPTIEPAAGGAELFLRPLDDDAARALVNAATADAPLHPHRRHALVRHAGGNPLFLEELIRAGAGDAEDRDLPDSVQAVVAAGLDRIPIQYRRLLQYAAVLGSEFERETLERIAREPVPSAAVLLREWRDLAVPAGDDTLRFRNRVVREVAYQTLSFRKRRELHLRAAEALEEEAASDANPPAEVLSLHFLHAQRYDRCWNWARNGAVRAEKLFANVEAARLYGRALAASRHLPYLEPRTIAEVWGAQADAWHRAGEYGRAEAGYQRARRLFGSDAGALARLHMRSARIAELQGNASTAIRRLRRGMRIASEAMGQAAVIRARLEVMHGWISHRRGQNREARRWAERALDTVSAWSNSNTKTPAPHVLAQILDASSITAEAYVLLDWTALHLGEVAVGEHAEKALPIFEAVNDLSQVAFTHNVLGAFAYYGGNWNEAADRYRRALETYERAGNEADADQARYNAAEVLLDQGRLGEARGMLEEIVRVYRAVGYQAGLALANRDLGRIAAREGDFELARRMLGEAREILMGFRAAGRVLEVDLWMADLSLRENRPGDALELITDIVARAEADGSATIKSTAQRIRGCIHASLGQDAEADLALSASLRDARRRGARHEIALTLDAMKAVSTSVGRAWPEDLELERAELFDQLGLRAAPTVVGAALSRQDVREVAEIRSP